MRAPLLACLHACLSVLVCFKERERGYLLGTYIVKREKEIVCGGMGMGALVSMHTYITLLCSCFTL